MGDSAGTIFAVAVAMKTPTCTLGASSPANPRARKMRSRAKTTTNNPQQTTNDHGIEQDGTNVRRREASCYIRRISSYEGGIYRKRNYCSGHEGGRESEHVSLNMLLLLSSSSSFVVMEYTDRKWGAAWCHVILRIFFLVSLRVHLRESFRSTRDGRAPG